MNRIIGGLVLSAITATAFAQSSTNSPYSQFGYGDLTDQGVGFNKGMNGVGLAFRKGNEVNPLNPASYSAADSLTMIFDAGLSGQITNFKEGSTRFNGKGGGFDYVVGLLRAAKNLGVSFGVLPYSNVGYKYSTTSSIPGSQAIQSSTYEGDGGMHQLFLGAGFRIFKPLSVGFNAAYLWGEFDRSFTGVTSISSAKYLVKQYSASVRNYKLDFGMQYEQKLGKGDLLTLGATYSPGHSLKTDPTCRIISVNTSASQNDTTSYVVHDGLSLPTAYGFGLAYSHHDKLRVGADLQVQKWGSVDMPSDEGGSYALRSGLLKDSYRANLGAEWIPNPQSTRHVLSHVRYRIGAGYATPYYNINGQDGPKELSLSLGFGIPIMNAYNNRSFLNISGQWSHRSADNLITENTFRINIGLTFNERWFSKWKVE